MGNRIADTAAEFDAKAFAELVLEKFSETIGNAFIEARKEQDAVDVVVHVRVYPERTTVGIDTRERSARYVAEIDPYRVDLVALSEAVATPPAPGTFHVLLYLPFKNIVLMTQGVGPMPESN